MVQGPSLAHCLLFFSYSLPAKDGFYRRPFATDLMKGNANFDLQ